jgi:hypothetical protein
VRNNIVPQFFVYCNLSIMDHLDGPQESKNENVTLDESVLDEEDNEPDMEERETTTTTNSDGDKKEKVFVRTVRSIRRKFAARRLVGNIYIYRVFGLATTAMRCKISESYYNQHHSILTPAELAQEELDDMAGGYKRAISMTDTILNSLERRSLNWDGIEFSDEVMLTRGMKFSISGPFIGIIGYSILVEISATVESLLLSRRRFEVNRANSISSSTSAGRRSFSFSLFSRNGGTAAHNNSNNTNNNNGNSGTSSSINTSSKPDSVSNSNSSGNTSGINSPPALGNNTSGANVGNDDKHHELQENGK